MRGEGFTPVVGRKIAVGLGALDRERRAGLQRKNIVISRQQAGKKLTDGDRCRFEEARHMSHEQAGPGHATVPKNSNASLLHAANAVERRGMSEQEACSAAPQLRDQPSRIRPRVANRCSPSPERIPERQRGKKALRGRIEMVCADSGVGSAPRRGRTGPGWRRKPWERSC